MTITGSNTTNFGIQKLGSNDSAGYSTINEVVDGIDTILNASDRLIKAAQTPTVAYVITGDGVDWVAGLVVTASITDLNVTTGKLADLSVTTGKIAASAVTAAKIDTSVALPGAPTVVTANGSYQQVLNTSRVATIQYVNDAAASLTAGTSYVVGGDLSGTTGAATIVSGAVTSAKIQNNTIVNDDLATALQAFLTPTGTVSAFAGSSAPTGYLLCDGVATHSTTTYAALFAVVGYTYGGSGGVFGVPDLRGRTVIGVGAGAELTAVLGVTPANMAATVALSAAETAVRDHTHGMKNHTHTGTTGGQSADHTHTTPFIQDTTILRGTGVVFDRVRNAGSTNSGGTSVDHNHGFTTSAPNDNTTNGTTEVAGAAHTNIQPSMPLNYIIKV